MLGLKERVMRKNSILSRRMGGQAIFLCLLGLLLNADVQAQIYRPGSIVTNFTVYARRAWVTPAGRLVNPGFPITLSDFAGHVVFFEFFDPT